MSDKDTSSELFSDSEGSVDVSPQEQTANPVENLVGEGKKYSSVDELAKAYENADRFISQLQQEQASLRDELNVRLSVEEAMTQLQSRDSKPQPQSTHATDAPRNEGAPETKNVVSPEEIASTVDSILSKKEQENRRKANISKTKAALAAAGWDSIKLRTEIAKQGYSESFIEQLAETEPQAFARLFGLDAAPAQERGPPASAPPRTQVNTTQDSLSHSGIKGKKYYDNLRRENPAQYFSPRVQNEIFRFIESHGEEVYYNN